MGDDDFAGVTAKEGGFAVVETEACFAFFWAVTFVAMGFEEGLDVFFEVGGVKFW